MSKAFQRIRTLLSLNLASYAGLHVLNRMITKKALSEHLLPGQDDSYYSWKFGQIQYRKYGDGPLPLLLIHDARPYSSGYEWEALVPYLSGQYTVYVPDLPGCGRSAKPAITYTNYLYVQFLTSFIRDVIGSPVIAAGTGLSFSFLVTAAQAEPSLFKELIAVNPMSPSHLAHVPDRRSHILQLLISLPVTGTAIYHFLCSRRNMEYLLNENYYFNPFKVRKKDIDAYYEAAHLQDAGGRYLRASIDGRYIYWNINRVLSQLSVPMTILYGKKQPDGRGTALRYKKLAPSAQIRCIPSSKMLPQREIPEVFAGYLKP